MGDQSGMQDLIMEPQLRKRRILYNLKMHAAYWTRTVRPIVFIGMDGNTPNVASICYDGCCSSRLCYDIITVTPICRI